MIKGNNWICFVLHVETNVSKNFKIVSTDSLLCKPNFICVNLPRLRIHCMYDVINNVRRIASSAL